jgi:hypothetical protein
LENGVWGRQWSMVDLEAYPREDIEDTTNIKLEEFPFS